MTSSLAAEVSLHCIICFEEFDTKDRPPVVLPCGHTYVCLVCAKRLRRCMECREPLFWTPPAMTHPKPQPILGGNPGLNTRSPAPTTRYGVVPRGRYSPGSQQNSPGMNHNGLPVKEEPVALPLPRNTVLMGMIEAADRQARLLDQARLRQEHERARAEGIANGFDEDETETDISINQNPDGRVSNLDPILAGMSALVGDCGTYAVREPLGLAVLPFDPNKSHHHEKEVVPHDVDENDEEKKTEETREPFTIEEGQKVQVVGVDEGVYQLARGAGYIVASVNQLVKVGGPLEKSCQYEGMLRSVLRKQDELQRELEEINGLVDGLKEKIHTEQESLPEHPVITPPKEIEEEILINDENDVSARAHEAPSTPTTDDTVHHSSSPNNGIEVASASSTEVNPGGNPRTPAQQHSSPNYMPSPPNSCPMPGHLHHHELSHPFIDGEPAGLPRYRVNSEDDIHGLPWTFGCGSTLFGERLIEHECDPGQGLALSFDDTLVEGTLATRNGTGRSLAARTIAANANLTPGDSHSLRSGSFDGPINFRTGMSGHTGLSLSRKKSSPLSRPNIRMMSEHRGIAATARAANLQQARRQHGVLEQQNYTME